MGEEVADLLRGNIVRMKKSVDWLRRSYKKCLGIGIKANYTEDEFDAFENLVGRFARTIDLIVNKVFRSIDVVELEDGGTTIDAVNRSEKRGIVESAARIRELRDLRNEIVHEYQTDDLKGLFKETLECVPEVLGLAERTAQYCLRFEH
jgi:uncharacterized protein YutE (UPF0331/DUF86 family)